MDTGIALAELTRDAPADQQHILKAVPRPWYYYKELDDPLAEEYNEGARYQNLKLRRELAAKVAENYRCGGFPVLLTEHLCSGKLGAAPTFTRATWKAQADMAKVLTLDEAQRVASNIANLPTLLKHRKIVFC